MTFKVLKMRQKKMQFFFETDKKSLQNSKKNVKMWHFLTE